MERRYELRLEQMLAQAEVSPELMRDLLKRLEAFVEPFSASLRQPEQRRHAAEYMTGLLSKLERKTGEAIAYLHDQERQGLQKFVGHVPWDHKPLLETLAGQVGEDLGTPDAVIVFDPSAFPKKGTKSVGVKRQYSGTLGRTDNCQVGVFLGYHAPEGHTLIDRRLFLPEEWAEDADRREEAGVPEEVIFRTKPELALEMVADAVAAGMPFRWVTGTACTGSVRRSVRGSGLWRSGTSWIRRRTPECGRVHRRSSRPERSRRGRDARRRTRSR